MDRSSRFFQEPVDRTPAGACASLAVFVIVLYLLGAWALWSAASHFKQAHHWSLSFSSFHLPNFNAPTNLNQQVQNTVSSAAASAAKSGVDAASQAAKDEVTKQAQTTQQNAQNSILNAIK